MADRLRLVGADARRQPPAARVFFSARNTNADPGVAISDDGGRTWRRSKPPEHTASLDPYIWVDEQTGSIFASDIDPPVTCTPISRSDDDGKTWRYSRACGVTDHQNHFGGPPPAGGEKPTGYPNVLYYCAISGGTLSDTSTITGCLKSLDGGSVVDRHRRPGVPAQAGPGATAASATAPTGHGIVDRRGNVYVPRGWCGAADDRDQPRRGRDVDAPRRSPTRRRPPFSHETGDRRRQRRQPLLPLRRRRPPRRTSSISRDGGNTWSDERDITPPGVGYASRPSPPHLDAGDAGPDRARLHGDGRRRSRTTNSVLGRVHGVDAQDALADDPLFYAAPVNDPATNALWKGACDDLRCGNIGDFLDVEIGPDGSAWSALVDSCPAAEGRVHHRPDASTRRAARASSASSPAARRCVGTRGRAAAAASSCRPPRRAGPPGRRACRSRRDFMIRLREPKRGRLRDGARVRQRQARARRSAAASGCGRGST